MTIDRAALLLFGGCVVAALIGWLIHSWPVMATAVGIAAGELLLIVVVDLWAGEVDGR